MDDDLRIIVDTRDHCLAMWHETVIDVWLGPVTVSEQLKVGEACERVAAVGRGPATYLGVVERSSPAPDESARTQLARWSRETIPKMAAAVIVADGGGFRSALVRGVGVALTALVPHRVPFKFFGSVEEAIAFLAPRLAAKSGGAAGLRACVEHMRTLQSKPVAR